MNIFDLRRELIDDYSSYVKSFIEVCDQRIHDYVEEKLFQRGLLWPEPLIQMNPLFETGLSIGALVDRGILHPACRAIFRRQKDLAQPAGISMSLYKHQQEAIELAREGHSYVLTTGTGSGKSLTYIVPIVDSILRDPGPPGVKAIVVYPMNALANSQEGELQKYLTLGYPNGERQVTFKRYTGQESPSERAEIIANPPDILLTNYVMLELILTRQREQPLLDQTQLRFLVLDELHTYRGRQGADVALLVRRVRNRLTPKGTTLQCVGTSATLASGGTRSQQRTEVASMASRLFGCTVQSEHVIGESLKRITPEVDETTPAFRQSLAERVKSFDPQTITNYEEFTRDPLAIWLESTFGVTHQEERLVRCAPRRIAGEAESAAQLLQQTTESFNTTDFSEAHYAEVIKQWLLTGYEQGAFAFRLHQFISKGDTVYATLEQADQRHITLQPQVYAPGGRERLLFPLVFCRECGQEYYVVRWKDESTLVTREVQDLLHETPSDDGKKPASQRLTGRPGFLFVDNNDHWPRDRDGIEERLPEEWCETANGKVRLTATGRKHRPLPLFIHPDGQVDEEEKNGTPCFFLPSSFLYCMHCGVTYSALIRSDFEKLSELSSEGRSTATTILSLSTIRHLRAARQRGEELTILPKMLSFTDNRQDASLQAGHFNDFIEIGLLRSALYRAVLQSGDDGIRHEELARKVFEALALKTRDFANNPEAKFQAKVQAERAIREVLGYRLYLDLRRGWRITSPNLEQCGLLEIAYQDLDEVCEDQATWEADTKGQKRHTLLAQMSVGLRRDLCKVLLDFMRRELAIKVMYLDASYNEGIKLQSGQHLKDPWAIDEDEELVHAGCLFPRGRGEGADRGYVYLSARGRYGRYLRQALRKAGFDTSLDDVQQIICDQLAALAEVGLIEEVVAKRHKDDVSGYQLLAASLIWRPGRTGANYHDPLRMPNLPDNQAKRVNQFFVDFYQENADHLERIQHLRAAEHTAQVPAERREEREKEFRLDEHDGRFLPILYCSPTMELGVDIAELNVVNMRNIPPTPANYAQRSGRAGRGGQPALVFSYCSTGSSHDQYFFQHPGAMVSGSVAPPRLDLANEDLLRAHVYAIWLAKSKLSLGDTLSDLLEIEGTKPTLQLKSEILDKLRDSAARQSSEKDAREVLKTLLTELEKDSVRWYTPNWLAETLNSLEQSFERACGRWRELYRAAQDQRDTQHAVTLDASRSADDREKAKRLRGEAEEQLKLLTASSSPSARAEFSEFYSYRYFASEGFLPGYNFPRLPLSAYIPARRARQHNEYLSRPRFLAISEFAPRAIIYHEGSRYIINRSLLRTREDSSGVLTREAKQCQHCGYLHPVTSAQSLDICQLCHKPLDHPLSRLFRLENVSTRRKDKINSDEEERQRQGYEIRTGVHFPPRKDGQPDYDLALVKDEKGETVARLSYGQAATLWRINFGPLRREKKDEYGFVLDTERGYWAKDSESAGDKDDPLSHSRMRVIPYVEDTRNCLLFEPVQELSLEQMASLQAALKSALQVHYQLEDNELAAEPLPDRNHRTSLLFYEATEGGAGVLRQLTEDRHALAEVAVEALRLCHFDPETLEDLHQAERALEPCEAACYHCLMTYANQRDHDLLDRQKIMVDLALLMQCSVNRQEPPAPIEPLLLRSAFDSPDLPLAIGSVDAETAVENGVSLLSAIEADWLREMAARGLMGPLGVHVKVGVCGAQPDFLYPDQVVIYVDGDNFQRQARDQDLVNVLENDGYMVIRFQGRENWEKLLADYVDMFRRHA
jgi:superfamily II DNA/RNA helicase